MRRSFGTCNSYYNLFLPLHWGDSITFASPSGTGMSSDKSHTAAIVSSSTSDWSLHLRNHALLFASPLPVDGPSSTGAEGMVAKDCTRPPLSRLPTSIGWCIRGRFLLDNSSPWILPVASSASSIWTCSKLSTMPSCSWKVLSKPCLLIGHSNCSTESIKMIEPSSAMFDLYEDKCSRPQGWTGPSL